MVYDANMLQKIITDNNDQYENKINKKISMFKQTLLSELEEIFKYYKIYVLPSSIESLLDDTIFSIKNNLGYKKIMIIISDAVSSLMSNKQNKTQILDEAIEKQNLINRQVDLNNSLIELKKNFSKLNINQTTLDEILSTIKRRLIFLQAEAGELTDLYIKTNKSKVKQAGQEIDVSVNFENKNITDVLNRCQRAINELEEDKAIAFLQNEFSMLSSDEIKMIIASLVSQVPFGTKMLEQFLTEKDDEIKNISNDNPKHNANLAA